jgi:hypothetical protein
VLNVRHSIGLSLRACTVVTIAALVAGAQAPSQRADSLFRARDWKGAAAAYQAIVTTDSSRGGAWFRLAISYAHLHDDTLALRHLRRASAFGFPASMVDSEPAFASLRATAEFAAIRAKAEDVRYPCRSEHTFDFWVGTFDTHPWNQPDSPSGGVLTNTRQYGGCVFIEQFSSRGGAGMSMSFYDVNRKVWRMIWNDDNNSSNDFEGSFRGGAMRFQGWVLDRNGRRILATNVLQPVGADMIRHIYSTSPDSGKTWDVHSDTRFVRRRE